MSCPGLLKDSRTPSQCLMRICPYPRKKVHPTWQRSTKSQPTIPTTAVSSLFRVVKISQFFLAQSKETKCSNYSLASKNLSGKVSTPHRSKQALTILYWLKIIKLVQKAPPKDARARRMRFSPNLRTSARILKVECQVWRRKTICISSTRRLKIPLRELKIQSLCLKVVMMKLTVTVTQWFKIRFNRKQSLMRIINQIKSRPP